MYVSNQSILMSLLKYISAFGDNFQNLPQLHNNFVSLKQDGSTKPRQSAHRFAFHRIPAIGAARGDVRAARPGSLRPHDGPNSAGSNARRIRQKPAGKQGCLLYRSLSAELLFIC